MKIFFLFVALIGAVFSAPSFGDDPEVELRMY